MKGNNFYTRQHGKGQNIVNFQLRWMRKYHELKSW